MKEDINYFYDLAIDFELEYERLNLEEFEPIELFGIPRPLVIKEKINNNAAKLLAFFLPLIAASFLVLNFLSSFLYILFRIIASDIKPTPYLENRIVYLDRSNKDNLDLIEERPHYLLKKNSINCEKNLKNIKVLTRHDYIKILKNFLYYVVNFDFKNYRRFLYTYSLIDFFETAFSLKRLNPSKLIFSNQYDRWLILCSAFKDTMLVQHGRHDIFNNKYIDMNKFKKKINITSIIALDDYSSDVFAKYITCTNIRVKKIVKRNKTKIDGLDCILVVGGSDDQKFFVDLIKSMINNEKLKGYKIIYKLHPRSKSFPYRHERLKITASQYNCGVYVTYGSTLDYHYQDLVRFIRYDWKEKSINSIIKKIEEVI